MATNDPLGLTASGIPAEMQAEYLGLTRQQAIAKALMEQGMTPMGGARRAGRFMVAPHPMEGVAKLAQTLTGAYMGKEADTGSAELGKRYQDKVTEALSGFNRTAQGTPGTPVSEDAAGNVTPEQDAVRGDPRKAVMGAMMDPYLKNNPMLPALSKMVTPDWEVVEQYDASGNKTKVLMDKNDPARSTRPFGQPQKVEPKIQDISVPTPEGKGDVPYHQKHISLDNGRTWKPVEGSVPVPIHAKSVGTTVNVPRAATLATIQDPSDPNQTLVVDANIYKGGGLGSPGVQGRGPKLTESGRANQKRQIAMQGVGDSIAQARDLLTGKGGQELPTESGLGSAVDAAAGFFGATPKGAASADRLRVVGGSLVQKVPRFEGPQSDKDVAYYKEVAGRIGDATIPIARRIAALEEVENIWGQFESGKKFGYFSLSSPQQSGGAISDARAKADAILRGGK